MQWCCSNKEQRLMLFTIIFSHLMFGNFQQNGQHTWRHPERVNLILSHFLPEGKGFHWRETSKHNNFCTGYKWLEYRIKYSCHIGHGHQVGKDIFLAHRKHAIECFRSQEQIVKRVSYPFRISGCTRSKC